MQYVVTSWNELLGANTNKLKSSNSLCHRAKPKHLESDSATGSWSPRVTTEDQSGDYTQTHSDQRPCFWGTVRWWRGWNAYCSPRSVCAQEWQSDALWYTDTETDVLVLMLAHNKNLTLKGCSMKKGRGANIICNSTQVMLTTASWGALLVVNSITGCDNIAAFFGKGKWKAIQLLQPKSNQYPMRTLNSGYRSTRVWTVWKEVA